MPSHVATSTTTGRATTRVRVGLVLDDIGTLNAGSGAQAFDAAACDIDPGIDSCGFQAGPTSYDTAGHI